MRKLAYRDGIEMWTEGQVFFGPHNEVIEVLYTAKEGGKKKFFVELPGIPACAHGDSIEEAIEEAKEKRGELEPITEEQKEEYCAENFKFSVSLFRKLTKACRSGIQHWLDERNLDSSVKMTIREFRAAGGGVWADKLEEAIEK